MRSVMVSSDTGIQRFLSPCADEIAPRRCGSAGTPAPPRVHSPERQLYLDCDGVLADFDKGATAVLGLPLRAYEKPRPGPLLAEARPAPDFYFSLPLMDDAMSVRGGEASRPDHPDGPAARQLGCRPEGALGRPALPGTRIITTRRATSATMPRKATCWSTTRTSIGIYGWKSAAYSSTTRMRSRRSRNCASIFSFRAAPSRTRHRAP